MQKKREKSKKTEKERKSPKKQKKREKSPKKRKKREKSRKKQKKRENYAKNISTYFILMNRERCQFEINLYGNNIQFSKISAEYLKCRTCVVIKRPTYSAKKLL